MTAGKMCYKYGGEQKEPIGGMNQSILDYYRCPENLVHLQLTAGCV